MEHVIGSLSVCVFQLNPIKHNNCVTCTTHCHNSAHRVYLYAFMFRNSDITLFMYHHPLHVCNENTHCSLWRRILKLNLQTPHVNYTWRTVPLTSKIAFYIFIQQIKVPNILNMVYTLRYFLSLKCSLFHNSKLFGFRIIQILYTECAKIKKIIPAPKDKHTRWFKYDGNWFVCKQAALRSSCATLRKWSHNLHPPSYSG